MCVCVCACMYICVCTCVHRHLPRAASPAEGGPGPVGQWTVSPKPFKRGLRAHWMGDCVPGCPVRLPPGPHQECQPLGSTQRTSLVGSLRGKRPPSPSAASAFGVLPWGAVCDPTLSGRGTCMCHMEVTLVLPRATLRTTSLPSELCLRTSTAMIWF